MVSEPVSFFVVEMVSEYDHAPRTSDCAGAFTSYRFPSTHVSLIFVFSPNNSPSVSTKFAALPDSIVPSCFSIPSIFAGIVVNAASASSAFNPRSIAVRTSILNFDTSLRVEVVKANGIPACLSRAGFSGAKSQWRNSSKLTSSASSGVLTFGASGKLTGRIIGAFVSFTASSRRYS